ncbi:hypothetical protein G7046_g997 [Stylonectria norvegica]|nr:hypothetical protein G7046_g997 [Stylonectria norvegica]
MSSPAPLIVIQPSAPHTHTVVFLHGRGDTAANFRRSFPYSTDSQDHSLQELFPSFRWVFPQAKIGPSMLGARVSQWFDVYNVRNFSLHEDLQAVGLKESVNVIRTILADEAAALGGHWDRVILAGISQGAATSVHTLLNLSIPPSTDGNTTPRGLGAFLGFSCRMPFPGRALDETRKILDLNNVPDDAGVLENTPMMLQHCVDDPLVLIANGRALTETLRGFGANLTWKEYPDGGHWFNSPSGIDDAADFLRSVLQRNPDHLAEVDSSSGAMDLS